MHMSRFCAGPYSLIKHNLRWAIEEMEVEFCCLEFDFLGSKRLIKVIEDKENNKKKKDDEGKVPLADASMDEQLIRGVSRNAPVVAFQMTFVLNKGSYYIFVFINHRYGIAFLFFFNNQNIIHSSRRG